MNLVGVSFVMYFENYAEANEFKKWGKSMGGRKFDWR